MYMVLICRFRGVEGAAPYKAIQKSQFGGRKLRPVNKS